MSRQFTPPQVAARWSTAALLGSALLSVVDACRDIRALARAG